MKYQVYALMKDGTKQNIGKPQTTKQEAHEFCKVCMAIIDTANVLVVEFEEVEETNTGSAWDWVMDQLGKARESNREDRQNWL